MSVDEMPVNKMSKVKMSVGILQFECLSLARKKYCDNEVDSLSGIKKFMLSIVSLWHAHSNNIFDDGKQ
jgi:hypothetical protein